jgi:hypothetical protein
MSSAPTIAADVTVTLDDSVAREPLSLAGVVEGDVPSWRLPDGSQTTDPQAALAGALRAIANGEGAAVRNADELPVVGSTITMTLPAPLALDLVEHVGLERSDDGRGWRTRDSRERTNEPRVAVTNALVAIACRTRGGCSARCPSYGRRRPEPSAATWAVWRRDGAPQRRRLVWADEP